jgi:DNA-binding response OmpR family regulator
VLFVSGHTNETISEDLLLSVHADYLQKPYLGGALAAKVQGVLAGAQAQLSEAPVEPYAEMAEADHS